MPPATPVRCPAQLFLELYAELASLDPTTRRLSIAPGATIKNDIRDCLRQDSPEQVCAELRRMSMGLTHTQLHGLHYAILQALDLAFYPIHPRAQRCAPAISSPVVPHWLQELRMQRTLDGYYCERLGKRLVPRGPLLRSSRNENATSANELADCFAALSVVSTALEQAAHIIPVTHKIISSNALHGVAPGSEPGHEQIVFLPIIDQADELQLDTRHDPASNTLWLDCRVAVSVDPVDRIMQALDHAPKADIALGAELVMREPHAITLGTTLRELGTKAPRLLLTGTGQTTRCDANNLPWNEARVINGMGKLLWCQSKLWPAGINDYYAEKYGLSAPPGSMIMENTASGDAFMVIDIDGLGRCAILICQDLQANPLAYTLVSEFQPDWIFAPLLDQGIELGRWAHQRCFELSAHSQARFLVCSSTALAAKAGKTSAYGCGLAVGPKSSEPALDQQAAMDRACKLLIANPGLPAPYATLSWPEEDWQQSVFGAR